MCIHSSLKFSRQLGTEFDAMKARASGDKYKIRLCVVKFSSSAQKTAREMELI